MNDLEPFARALLEKRRSNRQQPNQSPRPTQNQRSYEVKQSSFNQNDDDNEPNGSYNQEYYEKPKQRKNDARRQKVKETDEDSEIDQYKQMIYALKNKNRSLKTKILLLQNELQDAKQREDDNDPYLVSENEDLRAQLKQERVNNKLAQERIRVLENDIKSKEQIIKTKDLMIVHLQNACKEQANEYAKVADQLKLHVSGFNYPSKQFNAPADNFNDDFRFRDPPNAYNNRNSRNDFNDFNDFEKPSFSYNQGKDDFMDAFDESKNDNPPQYGYNDRNFEDKFDNFSEKPMRNPEPPVFDEPPIQPKRSIPQKRVDVPDGFQGGNYSEDMPVGGGGAARMQDRFSRQDSQNNESFDSFATANAEEIRKEIDKLLPRKAELERKLNLSVPKGSQQRDRDQIEAEFDKINKQISRLKLKLRQMAH